MKFKAQCPICRKNKPNLHPIYGVMPCDKCAKRRQEDTLPDRQIEFTTDNIRRERKEYAKSIMQPYRGGELSKEYLDLYGTKNIKPSKKEIAKAKNVWSDTFSNNMDLTKTK